VSSWTREPLPAPVLLRRERRTLNFQGARIPPELPYGLEAMRLDLTDCRTLQELPAGLRVSRLVLNGCTALETLPPQLSAYHVEARGAGLRYVGAEIEIEYKLDLQDCVALTTLPAGLRVPVLVLSGCRRLRALPEGLAVYFLDLAGCTAFERWPTHGSLSVGRLSLRGCERVTSLPRWIREIGQLDVGGCPRLTALPDGLRVTGWIDVAGSGLTRLPKASRGVELRWRGVPIDERLAFRPETITPHEVIDEPNVERRRVLLERCGYERFLRAARADLLDADTDAGGERRLWRVPMPRDEDVVCVAVNCPSTGKRYVLRVPPTTRTCRQAIAWIAGFDDPNLYAPVAET
jgi:hypothetical protein